jgi:hypothetical protein
MAEVASFGMICRSDRFAAPSLRTDSLHDIRIPSSQDHAALECGQSCNLSVAVERMVFLECGAFHSVVNYELQL